MRRGIAVIGGLQERGTSVVIRRSGRSGRDSTEALVYDGSQTGSMMEELIVATTKTPSDQGQRLTNGETLEPAAVENDPRDVGKRIAELKQFRPGWLDGTGLVPPADALDWIAAAF